MVLHRNLLRQVDALPIAEPSEGQHKANPRKDAYSDDAPDAYFTLNPAAPPFVPAAGAGAPTTTPDPIPHHPTHPTPIPMSTLPLPGIVVKLGVLSRCLDRRSGRLLGATRTTGTTRREQINGRSCRPTDVRTSSSGRLCRPMDVRTVSSGRSCRPCRPRQHAGSEQLAATSAANRRAPTHQGSGRPSLLVDRTTTARAATLTAASPMTAATASLISHQRQLRARRPPPRLHYYVPGQPDVHAVGVDSAARQAVQMTDPRIAFWHQPWWWHPAFSMTYFPWFLPRPVF
jgi:hypothetical protein